MKSLITVYVPNLHYRKDRRQSIVKEFADKEGFELHIVPAIEDKDGSVALWKKFYEIVEKENAKNSDFFIFCEDDHVFTEHYSMEYLRKQIEEADSYEADLLSGGMSFLRNPVQVGENLFWVSYFNGMQFTVIFQRLYKRILQSHTATGYVTDIYLSSLAKRKFVVYPYISVQREFGYSDATSFNNEEGRVERLFANSQGLLASLLKVKPHYSGIAYEAFNAIKNVSVEKIFMPVHIINMKERADRRKHILKEFASHEEFQPQIEEAVHDEVGAVGLWRSFCNIIRSAQEKDEDYVLICEDDHFFTNHYDKEIFFRQVMLAGSMGADLLSGGIGGFGNIVSLIYGLYWVDWFWCTQFIVIYKKAYDTILKTIFTARDVADEKLSKILKNKMVIAPYISEQTDFGYSDITSSNNADAMILRHFDNSRRLLKHYEYVYSNVLPKQKVAGSDYIDIERCFNEKTTLRLNLGCGTNLLQGWLNTDIQPTYGAAFLDVMQKFPFPNDSVDCIYAEHLLDLFPAADVVFILEECLRVLKKGGTIRLVCYSNENVVNIPNESASTKQELYMAWNLQHYGKGRNNVHTFPVNIQRSLVLSNFYQKYNNLYLYDKSFFEATLSHMGFEDFKVCSISKSPTSQLCGLESHKVYVPMDVYEFEILIVEAKKLYYEYN